MDNGPTPIEVQEVGLPVDMANYSSVTVDWKQAKPIQEPPRISARNLRRILRKGPRVLLQQYDRMFAVGVELKKDAQDIVKALMEQGEVAAAQKYILDELGKPEPPKNFPLRAPLLKRRKSGVPRFA